MSPLQASTAFEITFEREADGRWIASVASLPGALAYGQTKSEAESRVKALVFHILADRLEHGEATPEFASRLFQVQ